MNINMFKINAESVKKIKELNTEMSALKDKILKDAAEEKNDRGNLDLT